MATTLLRESLKSTALLLRALGDANWWAPAPLRRLHHRLRLTD